MRSSSTRLTLLLALTAVARSADPSVPHIHSGAFKQYQHAKPSKYGLSAGRVPKSERSKLATALPPAAALRSRV